MDVGEQSKRYVSPPKHKRLSSPTRASQMTLAGEFKVKSKGPVDTRKEFLHWQREGLKGAYHPPNFAKRQTKRRLAFRRQQTE